MDDITPLVSVIIPCYKVELYLQKCIESVLSQNVQNWEAVLVDDGSPDACPAICDEYAKKDSRITVVHKENSGLSDARNAGMKVARGKYVLFLDSDDYLYSDTVLNEIVCSLSNAGYPDICYLPNEYWASNPKSVSGKYKDETISLQQFLNRVVRNYYLHTAGQQFVLRLDYIKKNNVEFKKGILHEDELWFFQILYNAKNIHICPCVFYFYVDNRSGSIMNAVKEKNIEDKIFIAEKIIADSKPLPKNLQKLFFTRVAQIVSGIFQSENAMEIVRHDKNLQEKIKELKTILLKSKKNSHKFLYLYAKIKGY